MVRILFSIDIIKIICNSLVPTIRASQSEFTHIIQSDRGKIQREASFGVIQAAVRIIICTKEKKYIFFFHLSECIQHLIPLQNHGLMPVG